MDLRWIIAATLLLAGCSSPGSTGALSQEEAEQQADLAVERLTKDMANLGDDLTRLQGDFEMEDGDFGAGHVTFDIEWGRQETAHMLLEMDLGGGGASFSFAFEMWCTASGEFVKFDGTTYESRPTNDCQDMFSTDDNSDELNAFGLDEITPGELEDIEPVSITPNGDGSITAVYEDEGAQMTFTIIDGRITQMDVDSEEGTGSMTLRYGTSRVITAPAADERLPASVSAYCFYSGDQCQAAVTGEGADLDEFEVRVYPDGSDPSDAQPLAVFPVSQGDATHGEHTIDFDLNGDGLFGDGDTFTVTGPEGEIVIWDTWADKSTDEQLPGPALGLLIVGLIALARRR